MSLSRQSAGASMNDHAVALPDGTITAKLNGHVLVLAEDSVGPSQCCATANGDESLAQNRQLIAGQFADFLRENAIFGPRRQIDFVLASSYAVRQTTIEVEQLGEPRPHPSPGRENALGRPRFQVLFDVCQLALDVFNRCLW